MIDIPQNGERAQLLAIGLEALTRRGTESLQAPRWRELDSNFQFPDTRKPFYRAEAQNRGFGGLASTSA